MLQMTTQNMILLATQGTELDVDLSDLLQTVAN